MYDVITIGSAFQDVYVFSKKFRVLKDSRVITGEVECFAFGTKIELDDILFEVGGGATNTAYTLKRQGLKVGCLSRIGRDGAGQEVCSFLKKSGIGDFSIVDRTHRTAHSVIFLAGSGERTILVYRGAAHEFAMHDVPSSIVRQARWLYISSLAGNISLLRKVLLTAQRYRVGTCLNPGKLEITEHLHAFKKLLKYINILLVNHEEAVGLTHRAYDDEIGILRDLHALCPGVVIVTNGAQGSLCADGGKYIRVSIRPVKAVDTTGAGDAFGSGFLAGYLRYHGNLLKAITLASENAASDVMKIGAKHGILSKNQRFNSIRISVRPIR